VNRLGLLALVAAVSVAGCGVETEETARTVNPPSGVAHAWATPTPPDTGTGAVPERLYLVRDGRLVAITRHVRADPTVDELVDDLLAGPTGDERSEGVTSALLGSDVAGVRVSGGRATVELTEMIEDSGRTDQILAFAQIVCTLTAKPGITSVAFIHAGQPVGRTAGGRVAVAGPGHRRRLRQPADPVARVDGSPGPPVDSRQQTSSLSARWLGGRPGVHNGLPTFARCGGAPCPTSIREPPGSAGRSARCAVVRWRCWPVPPSSSPPS
jgi:hypothetical protein